MKWHGILGILMVLFTEINFILKIEPFASLYFPIVWFGYIFVIDSLVFKINKSSLLTKNRKKFLFLLVLSAVFWWIFELINFSIKNWGYTENPLTSNLIFGTIAFSTVLPAFFETSELFISMHLFDKVKLHKEHKIKKYLLFGMLFIGVIALILPLLFPKIFFPLVWLSLFFLLDPINYMNKQPSIIQHLKDKKLAIPLALLLTGIILGLLWEFWNYFAVIKWIYSVPFFNFLKIFEMPLLGYFGYFPFAFELYAMYHFSVYLYRKVYKL